MFRAIHWFVFSLLVFAAGLNNADSDSDAAVLDSAASEAEDKDTLSEVKVEFITKLSDCEGSIGITDIGVFDADIWYKVGDRKENSLAPGQKKPPYTIELGKKKFLEAIEKNIIGMCVGEKRRITIPPNLAYGNRTIKFTDGRNLTGGATIISEFKLLQIIPNDDETKKMNFGIMDTDGNGFIDKEEIRTIILLSLSLLDDKDVPDVDTVITSTFDILDKDGDHLLSIDEFFETSTIDGEPGNKYFESLLKKMIDKGSRKQESCPVCPTCQPKKPCQTNPTCSTCSNKANTITNDEKPNATKNTKSKSPNVSGERKEDSQSDKDEDNEISEKQGDTESLRASQKTKDEL